MKVLTSLVFAGKLVVFLTVVAFGCGPQQFGGSTPAFGATTGEQGGFESVEGADEGWDTESAGEDVDTEGVIVSDDSDEAWDGVETDGGDDWHEREK